MGAQIKVVLVGPSIGQLDGLLVRPAVSHAVEFFAKKMFKWHHRPCPHVWD